MDVAAYAAPAPGAPLERTTIVRRTLKPNDILIEIAFAGICHSDIHQAREEWGKAAFPMVPGHEIAGVVREVGSEVRGFAVGDHAGVGCMVDSCRTCSACRAGLEQYCTGGVVWTYNSTEKDGSPTYGGYSTHIVVDADFALQVPRSIPLDQAAPLLCAGVTLYSPLKHWNVGEGTRVGVMGLGGLGHMGVKLAAAMGAEVTLISHSPSKEEDARRLGAQHFLLGSDRAAMREARHSLDLIVNTVSADLDLSPYLTALDLHGAMCIVGLPGKPLSVNPGLLLGQRRSLSGSSIGGIAETQEMLDFCAESGLGADVEVIPGSEINEAYERVVRADVRYRFSIDASTI